MSQTGVNNESHDKFDNLEEELSKLSQNKADEVTSEEVFEDLSLSITSINSANLYMGLQFEHWGHVNLILLAYRQKERFAWRIQDKKLDKNGEDFNARMSSTQYVESINAVIHKYVNSHSSLMGFFNKIQAMLASELQKAEYRDYLESLSYNVGSSASIRVFSKLIEYLKLALTDEIFQIQKAQIDICFKYNALPIPFEQFSLYDNANIVDNITCIQDDSNKRQVALKSLIRHVDPNNVIELWKVRHMDVNTVSMNCIVLLKDQSHVCTCLLLFSEGLVCQHFFQVMLKTSKVKFSIALIKNRWYKKSADLHKVNTLFDSCSISNSSEELFTNDEIQASFSPMNTIRNFRTDDLNNSALASEFNLTHIAATLKGLIQQVEQANGSSSNSLDFDTIQNPFLANSRGRHAKRIKSSIEIHTAPSKTVNTKTRSSDTYTCRNCLNDGHNARSCVALCKTCNKSGHTYLKYPNKEIV
ncbi:11795_t:CDS:2 [Cetraspora pellucida]|uniref:11795_t:CDS:1 n=1 Tax=Cetraspora pellucida TaxID=1433469 RepID=A0ACA9KPY7_9GLOM|nr:11795_t:CDS:2 [Cetraspora pellucida]